MWQNGSNLGSECASPAGSHAAGILVLWEELFLLPKRQGWRLGKWQSEVSLQAINPLQCEKVYQPIGLAGGKSFSSTLTILLNIRRWMELNKNTPKKKTILWRTDLGWHKPHQSNNFPSLVLFVFCFCFSSESYCNKSHIYQTARYWESVFLLFLL